MKFILFSFNPLYGSFLMSIVCVKQSRALFRSKNKEVVYVFIPKISYRIRYNIIFPKTILKIILQFVCLKTIIWFFRTISRSSQKIRRLVKYFIVIGRWFEKSSSFLLYELVKMSSLNFWVNLSSLN